MLDGAPCHRSELVKDHLQEKNVDALEWPGNSPDLLLIENLWHMIKIKAKDQHLTSVELLKTAMKIV